MASEQIPDAYCVGGTHAGFGIHWETAYNDREEAEQACEGLKRPVIVRMVPYADPVASEYPEAWGVLKTESGVCWWQHLKDTPPPVGVGCRLVRLIPAPEVERLVREAEQRGRDAERERCKMVAESVKLSLAFDFGTGQTIWDQIESGEQPGEGGVA
jgi:hypothetical protein